MNIEQIQQDVEQALKDGTAWLLAQPEPDDMPSAETQLLLLSKGMLMVYVDMERQLEQVAADG